MLSYHEKENLRGIDSIRTLSQKNIPLAITNSYQGIAITQNIKTIAIQDDYAIFQIPDKFTSNLKGKEMYLHGSEIEGIIYARVAEINFLDGKLILTDFHLVNIPWHERHSERVQPKDPTRIHLQFDAGGFSACLANLSLHGVGIFKHKLSEKGFNLTPDDPIQIDYQLPGIRSRLIMKSRVIGLRHFENSGMSYIGLETFPSETQIRCLRRYISQRKIEIFEELDLEFSRSFEPVYSKDLYF